MKFSVTAEFSEITEREDPDIPEDSEQAKLARDIFMLLHGKSIRFDNSHPDLFRSGQTLMDSQHLVSHALTRMAAQKKLTELRMLHSILVTYPSYILRGDICVDRIITRCVTRMCIEIELDERTMTIEAEVNGSPRLQRIRQIDLETSPNMDGAVAMRDDPQMPKRRMRLKANS